MVDLTEEQHKEADIKNVGEIIFMCLTGENFNKPKEFKKKSNYKSNQQLDTIQKRLKDEVAESLSEDAKDFLKDCIKEKKSARDMLDHAFLSQVADSEAY